MKRIDMNKYGTGLGVAPTHDHAINELAGGGADGSGDKHVGFQAGHG